jgi:glucose 1-dehydrogenase
MQRLDGQIALVTGASSGIGAAIATALGTAGACVAINYVGKEDDADRIVQRLRQMGRDAMSVRADVSDAENVSAMFAHVVEAFGRLDILVANAGVQHDAASADMTLEAWKRVIDVNLTGQFLCAQQAIRQFLSQDASPKSKARGKIICISSVHDEIPWAGHVNYAASKGGVMLMMKTLAQEVAAQGIRVNAIAPGAIKTGINKDVWSDPAQARKLLQLIPYGRIGEPEDVARVAAWLASDEADYITGASIRVDGGMSLYPAFRTSG